ncbi:MAG: condensation domain-containing protein, partial [Rhodococcus sp. (in: high G+C Gram-positive bacteria)]
YQAPVTTVEETVAQVFSEVLGVAQVGRDDDFFELGGNSLIATRVAARLGEALDTSVPVRALFEASTVQSLAIRLELHAGSGATAPLVPQSRPARIPLSLAQQRMWFLNRFEPESAVNNIPAVLRISGNLDVTALDAAVRDVVERHEVLRTVYPETDGIGYQLVLSVSEMWSGLTPIVITKAAIEAEIAVLVTVGFDVTTEVPLRVRLFQLSDGEYVLAFVVHHISTDGFSMAPLTRDLMLAYEARTRGGVPSWAPLPVQYVDYTLWQRDVLGSESDEQSVISRQIGYWREALAELPGQLDLPNDRTRPQRASGRGANYDFIVDAQMQERLEALGRTHNASLFMTVHAALAVTLARLSGTTDIAIGTPVAGRGQAQLDDLVGMFVNTLVLRTEIDPAGSFAELLSAVRERDLEAFAHADVPFERLVEVLEPVRSQARHPLFQVMLSFQNLSGTELVLGDLTVSPLDSDLPVAKFDLQLTLTQAVDQSGVPSGLAAQFTYATDLFDESTVASFADGLCRVLASVTTDSLSPVGAVEILDEEESSQILGWSRGQHVPSADVSILGLFAQTVVEFPERSAVVAGNVTLSYADLDVRSSVLA